MSLKTVYEMSPEEQKQYLWTIHWYRKRFWKFFHALQSQVVGCFVAEHFFNATFVSEISDLVEDCGYSITNALWKCEHE